MRKNTFLFNLLNEGKMYNKHSLLSLLPTARHKKLLGFLILACIASIGLQAQTIRYVKAGATGDGSSWTNASGDLQVMNDNSAVGDQIWVAAGTYTPLYDKIGDRNPSDPKKRIFKITDGVKLYGGFEGTESSLSQRNFKTNVTILSGDFNNDDVLNSAGTIGSGQGNNAEYVLYADGSTGVTIDGFSITGASNGGGMSIENGQNVIANNLIYNNYANNGGAGIYAGNGTHLILNNIIHHNVASGSSGYGNGGGIFMYNTSNSKVINNVIYSNYASNNGGGVNLQEGSNLQMMNNTIYNNNANTAGGLYIYKKNNNIWNFYGNVFSNNQSEGNNNTRSADYWEYNVPFGNPDDPNDNGWNNYTNRFENNHFQLSSDQYYAGIQLTGFGAALFDRYYGNNANFGPGNIFAQSQLFKNSSNPAGEDNILRTADDGLSLISCSALIDKGNSIVMNHYGLDIVGQNRSQISTVDIGAYENWIVESAPDVKILFGGGATCANGTGKSLTINNSQSGVSYQFKKSGVGDLGSAISGTGGTISSPPQLHGRYYAVASTPNGCTVTMIGADTNFSSEFVNIGYYGPLPSPSFYSGASTMCAGSTNTYNAGAPNYTGTYSVVYSIDKNIGASINPTTGVVSNVTGNFTVVATATSECGDISIATRSVTINVLANANVVQGQSIRYVKQGGTGNGASWATASGNLQAVINNSVSGDQVWVAAGTYTPSYDEFGNCSPQDDKNRLFKIKDGVKLYGGFAGTESSLSQRNFKTNLTILSGDINNDDVLNSAGSITSGLANNVYYVVYAKGSTGVTIDGFSITGAYNGGGMSIENGQNVISNNLIYNNHTKYAGAGIYAGEGTFLIINNIIHHNAAYGSDGWGFGAGIYMYKSVNSKIINNVIAENDSNNGAAGLALNQGSNLQMMNNTIYGNKGGLFIYKEDNNIWNFYGNIFSSNTGDANDDGRQSDFWEYNKPFNSSPTDGFYNFTNHFENNHFQLSSDKYYRGVKIGSALFNQNAGNNADFGPGNLFAQEIKFKGGFGAGLDGIFHTADDGLALSSCSPLINKGSSNILSSYNLDITGQNRSLLGSVDMGAYESPLVESLPGVYNVVSAGGSFCNGAGGIEIGLSGSQLGVTYYLYYLNGGRYDLLSQVNGNGGRISFGSQTKESTYKVLASTTAGACSAGWMQGEIGISNNFCCADYPADVLYVNAGVSGGNGKGSSWANAFSKLSDAIYVTKKCGARVIKVATGVYRETIKVPNDVTLEGGYNAATGNRNISANVTVLSGDFNNDDIITGSGSTLSIANNSENVEDVVTLGNFNSIDGFSITGGKGAGISANYGAWGSTISNNIVYGNGQHGIYVNDGYVTMTKNTICRNGDATYVQGGGIYIYMRGDANIWDNTIYGNKATEGGGIFATGDNYNTVYNISCKNNTIYDNFATTGGGIYAYFWYELSQINFYCENNTIYNNTATDGGGAYAYCKSSSNRFICTNSTFYNNSANEGGGVLMNTGAYLTNTIFWGNKKGNSTTTIGADINSGSTCYVSNSLLQVYSSGTNCVVGQDPLFVDANNPAGSDGIHRTADDGLSLQVGSPAINSPYLNGTSTDITGRAVVDARDMGAYEWFDACKPFAFRLTDGGTYCEGSTGFEIGLSGSENGAVYQLKKGATNVGAAVSGTGAAISFGLQTKGVYTVEATKLSTACTATMLNSAEVLSKPIPALNGIKVSNNCGNSILSVPAEAKTIVFDGNNDYINIGNVTALNNAAQFTIEAMLNISDYSQWKTIFAKRVNENFLIQLQFYPDNPGRLIFSVGNGSASRVIAYTPSEFPLNRWTHVAVVYNANAMNNNEKLKIYIDGIESSVFSYVTNIPSSTGNNTADFLIGNENTNPTSITSYKGSMDNFKIWDRALSAQEISNQPNNTGLITEYKFDEANGSTTAVNSVGNSNTGTLFNFNNAAARQVLTSYLWSTGATSNSITVVNPGTYTVVASHVNGCSVSTSATVSPGTTYPTTYSLSASGAFCPFQVAGLAVVLAGSQTGVSYQLKKLDSDVGSPIEGTGSAINFGLRTAGTYTVLATNNTSGCTTTMTGTAVVTVENCCPSGNTVYVNGSGVNGTGDSWANAFTSLSDVLYYAHQCSGIKTIKVAAGTYKPTRKPISNGIEVTIANDRNRTFHIPDGVTIEGGYNALTGVRDISANTTTLSGDFNGNDVISGSGSTLAIASNDENAYCVLLFAPPYSTTAVGAKIDGFSVTGGNANAANSITVNGINISIGGGFYTENGDITLKNSILYGNTGGGLRSKWSNLVLINNAIFSNFSVDGGGIYAQYGTLDLSNNVLYGNRTTGGGGAGMFLYGGTHTINSNTLYGNSASSGGGGIYIHEGSSTISNNILYSNSAGNGGGIAISGGSHTIRNNALYGNSASGSGGGIFISYGTNTITNNTLYGNTGISGAGGITIIYSTSTLTNNIFWDNKVNGANNVYRADYNDGSSTNIFKNNLLQLQSSDYTIYGNNLAAGSSGNIFNQNPNFFSTFNIPGDDNKLRTIDDGLRLKANSPCFNTGTATGAPTTDILGVTRPQGAGVDMGAYERFICTPPTAYNVTGSGWYCVGANGLAVGLSNSEIGVNYQLKKGELNIGSPISGTGAAISFGVQLEGTYTVFARKISDGCEETMTGTAVISNSANVYAVTSSGYLCATNNNTVPVGLSGSQTGVSYQLMRANVSVGNAVVGTGTALSFGNQSTIGTYTVIATLMNGGCTASMSGEAKVDVTHVLSATFTSSSASACSGKITVYSVAPTSYSNMFNTVPTGATSTGFDAFFESGSNFIKLTPDQNSKKGYLYITDAPAYGTNRPNYLELNFKAFMGSKNGADGFSVNISPNINVNTSNDFENGILDNPNNGLVIRFKTWNQDRIELFYNGNQIGGAVNFPLEFGNWKEFKVTIKPDNTLSLVCKEYMSWKSQFDETTIFNNVQLPGYTNINPNVAFAARTGGQSNEHIIDDVVIKDLRPYEYSLDNSTWQTSNIFSNLAGGTYAVYGRVPGMDCGELLGNVTVTAKSALLASVAVTNSTSGACTGSITVSSPSKPISYSNLFDSAPTGATSTGFDAFFESGSNFIKLTANQNSKKGYLYITDAPAYGSIRPNYLELNFRAFMLNKDGADGFSVNISPNINVNTSNDFENGILDNPNNGLVIRFKTWNQDRIEIFYNGTQVGGTVNYTLEDGIWKDYKITIKPDNTISLVIAGNTVFNNVALPAYTNLNPNVAFAARTGGSYNEHIIDNVVIKDLRPYEYSLDNTTWQTSNVFANQTSGAYTVYGRLPGMGCGDVLGNVNVTANSALTANIAVTNNCKNSSLDLTTNGTSFTWSGGSTLEDITVSTAGVYMVTVTDARGCTKIASGTATFIPPPAQQELVVLGSLCDISTTRELKLNNSETGVSYQLYKNNSIVGSLKTGTGGAISFGNQTEGTYTVVATNAQGCTAVMTGNAVITISETIASSTVTGGGILCDGDDGGLSIGLSNSVTGVTYQLKKNGNNVGSPIDGTGGALAFGNFFDAGTYTVVATNAQGCTAVMTGNAIITLSTLSESYTVTGGGTYCAGLDGVVVGLSGSQTGVSYQLKKDNTNVGTPIMGTGAAISFGKQTAAGTYTVNATLLVGACTIIFQNSVVVSVDETLPTFVSASVPANITLNCTDAIPTAVTLSATNSCSTVTMNEVSTKGTNAAQCDFYSYTITRTWTATDKRNNTATVSQVITVQDNTAPVIAPLANITVTEGTIPTTIANTDNCMASPNVTFTETKVTHTPPPCKNYSYTLTRTWRVTDACGNSSTATQTIKAEGIYLTCPSDKTIYTNSDGVNNYNCSSLATAAMGVAPSFTDGCDAAVLRYTITGVTTGTGNGSIAGIAFAKGVSKITYSLVSNVSDQCSLNLTVLDNEGPKITLTPTVVLDACTMPSPIPDIYKPTLLDNCTGTNTLEVMNDVLADQTGCATKVAAQKYTKLLTRTWKATDENGNTSTAVQRIYLRDNVPPITVCKNVTVNIGSANITLPVSSLNNGSNDNCTAATALTFVGCMNTTTACTNFGANLTLKASMIPAGQNQTTITVRVKARDACGNETATPVSTIITLKRIGTMNNATNGSEHSMAIQDTESSIPAEASTVPTVQGEMKCYPTPFSEDLNIQYNLTENVEMVTLKVYDTQGRLVKTMEQEAQLIGFYQVRWNLSDLSAGMYHVCLELNGKCTKMERVIMMK